MIAVVVVCNCFRHRPPDDWSHEPGCPAIGVQADNVAYVETDESCIPCLAWRARMAEATVVRLTSECAANHCLTADLRAASDTCDTLRARLAMTDSTWLQRLMDAGKVAVTGSPGLIGVELMYPRLAKDDPERPTHVEVGLCDVRAADSIRISYDFQRDGWKIEQAQRFRWEVSEELNERGLSCGDPGWIEVAFVEAWGSQKDELAE